RPVRRGPRQGTRDGARQRLPRQGGLPRRLDVARRRARPRGGRVVTRIAIAADLHVDPYFDRRDPETGANMRELDMLRTVGWVAREARERGADALVIAGDYTEAKKVAKEGHGPTTGRIAAIRDALVPGPDRQIHVRGNHDHQWRGK